MWTRLRQQQQRGAQLGSRRPGEAPKEATRDRSAQDHEEAGGAPRPGKSPASPIENRDQDTTPAAPEPHAGWDEVVQPERAKDKTRDDLPLPEGK